MKLIPSILALAIAFVVVAMIVSGACDFAQAFIDQLDWASLNSH